MDLRISVEFSYEFSYKGGKNSMPKIRGTMGIYGVAFRPTSVSQIGRVPEYDGTSLVSLVCLAARYCRRFGFVVPARTTLACVRTRWVLERAYVAVCHRMLALGVLPLPRCILCRSMKKCR